MCGSRSGGEGDQSGVGGHRLALATVSVKLVGWLDKTLPPSFLSPSLGKLTDRQTEERNL